MTEPPATAAGLTLVKEQNSIRIPEHRIAEGFFPGVRNPGDVPQALSYVSVPAIGVHRPQSRSFRQRERLEVSQIFRTEAAVMKQAAANVDATNDDIRNELGRLRSVVEQVRGSWDGAAQASFDELMSRWNTAAVKLQESLGSISENLRSNAGAFENVEAQNADALRRTDVTGLQL